MAYEPVAVTQPIASLRHVWKHDDTLIEPLKGHLLAVSWVAEKESREGSILFQTAVVVMLQLYRRSRERELDALTQARVVGEIIRALRSLGLLGRLHVSGAGRHPRSPSAKKQVPRSLVRPTTPDDFTDQDGDEAAG